MMTMWWAGEEVSEVGTPIDLLSIASFGPTVVRRCLRWAGYGAGGPAWEGRRDGPHEFYSRARRRGGHAVATAAGPGSVAHLDGQSEVGVFLSPVGQRWPCGSPTAVPERSAG